MGVTFGGTPIRHLGRPRFVPWSSSVLASQVWQVSARPLWIGVSYHFLVVNHRTFRRPISQFVALLGRYFSLHPFQGWSGYPQSVFCLCDLGIIFRFFSYSTSLVVWFVLPSYGVRCLFFPTVDIEILWGRASGGAIGH